MTEKLTRFAGEWKNNPNPVTRASYRNMFLKLWFDEYGWAV